MKRLIKNLLIVFVLSSSVILSLNFVYKSLLIVEKSDITKFSNVPKDIIISNTGSSHGQCSFYWESVENRLNGEHFNFDLSGQSLYYDNAIVTQYKDNLSEGGIMLIPISYFSLYRNEVIETNFKNKNIRYLNFLDNKSIRDYDTLQILYKELPVIFFEVAFTTIKDQVKENLELNTNELAEIIGRTDKPNIWDDKASELANLDEIALEKYKAHWNIISENGINVNINSDEYDALINLVSICKEKNITPLLVTTPLLRIFDEHFSEDFKSRFHADIEKIAIEQDVTYIDFSTDNRFYNVPELFYNSDHLNIDGAKLFTGIIYDYIIENELLKVE